MGILRLCSRFLAFDSDRIWLLASEISWIRNGVDYE